MSHTIMGIDPGKYGGIVLLHDDDFEIDTTAFQMPYDHTAKLKGGSAYYKDEMADIIIEFDPDVLVIEHVTRPSSLVRCMALFEGIAAARDIECVKVTPLKWKKYFNLSRNKQESIDLALRIYPQLKEFIDQADKDKDGIAEAALIAEYHRVAKFVNK
jgi:hypothetical protein